MTTDTGTSSGRLWEQARAALARLFGHVSVQHLPLDALGQGVAGKTSEATRWADPLPGPREGGWQLEAVTAVWDAPACQPGAQNTDFAAVPCLVSANHAPHLVGDGVQGGAPGPARVEIYAVDAGRGASWAGTVWPLPLTLTGGEAYRLPIQFGDVTLRFAPLTLAGGGTPEAAARRGRSSGVPPVRVPETKSYLAVLTRVPMTRRRAVPLPGVDPQVAFAAERHHLAASCGAPVDDVLLLAAFPRVPLALVQQMAIGGDGETLRLWLRPQGLGGKGRAATVTVVLGRRRSTGELIRAVMTTAGTGS